MNFIEAVRYLNDFEARRVKAPHWTNRTLGIWGSFGLNVFHSDGRIEEYVPLVDDILADDWEVVT